MLNRLNRGKLVRRMNNLAGNFSRGNDVATCIIYSYFGARSKKYKQVGYSE